MHMANLKNSSGNKCAFCKFWYDPTNSAINPKSPNVALWEYDEKISKKCLKKNVDIKAFATCSKFESKIKQ